MQEQRISRIVNRKYVEQVHNPACRHHNAEHVRRNRQHGYEEALINNVNSDTACKNAVGGFSRCALHKVALALFHSKRKRGEAVGNEVNPEQVCRLKNNEAENVCKEDRQNLAHIRTEKELNCLLDIVVNSSALFDSGNYRGKVIVGKDHIGDVLCNVCTRDAHAHADIGALY